MNLGPLTPELWFRDGFRRRLPAWAQWMVQLGQLASRPADSPRRVVVAIALPSRAYAATLVAVGCVIARDPLRFSRNAPNDEELAAHFANLASSRPRTTVTVASGTAKHVGQLLGTRQVHGEPHLVIEQNGFTQLIPQRDAHNVAVRGLGLSCLIAGQLNVLEQEIAGGDVVTADGRPLQALLKVRRFCTRDDKDIRSDVITARTELPAELRDAQPGLVVFDGADAFRKRRESWREAAWVVVLDQTSRQFAEGVGLVEEEFIEKRYDDGDPLEDIHVPPGVELMSFWGRVK
jgi:hypothetical protein